MKPQYLSKWYQRKVYAPQILHTQKTHYNPIHQSFTGGSNSSLIAPDHAGYWAEFHPHTQTPPTHSERVAAAMGRRQDIK